MKARRAAFGSILWAVLACDGPSPSGLDGGGLDGGGLDGGGVGCGLPVPFPQEGSAVPEVPTDFAVFGRAGSVVVLPLADAGVALFGACREDCAASNAAFRAQFLLRVRNEAQLAAVSAITARRLRLSPSGSGGAGGGLPGVGGNGGAIAPPPTQIRPFDYSTTTVQLAGVDEADVVKSDGQLLVVASGSAVSVLTMWPAADLRLRSRLTFAFPPSGLSLTGERLVVLGEAAGSTHVELWLLTDPTRPTRVGRWVFSGTSAVSRRVGGQLRLTFEARSSARVLPDLGLSAPLAALFDVKLDEAQIARAAWSLATRAAALADDATLERLYALPHTFSDQRQGRTGTIALAATPLVRGVTGVATIDLDGPPAPARVHALLVAPGTVAGIEPGFVLATQRHESSPTGRSDLVRVALDGPQPQYAHGVLDGWVSGPMAVDEAAGVLRVVASKDSGARVVTFERTGEVLRVLGTSGEMGRNEQVTAVRFDGPRAYVVTFPTPRWPPPSEGLFDPLYTVDLSRPATPAVLGELHIPGFSTFVMPIDGQRLLSVGTWVNPNAVFSRAVQLQQFDVGDLAAPRRTHLTVLGDSTTSSEAQLTHHAFTYFAARAAVAVPYRRSEGQSTRSNLRVWGVSADAGFVEKGTLEVDPPEELRTCTGSPGFETCVSRWTQPAVRRSVMADDFVYGVSDRSVTVARIATPNEPVASALLDPP